MFLLTSSLTRTVTLFHSTRFVRSPLVFACWLPGSMRVDLTRDPLGTDSDGAPINLADIWPTPEELDRLADSVLVPERYEASYATMFDGDRRWQDIQIGRANV